jgi:acetolactate synthase-1/2/3 large subunit
MNNKEYGIIKQTQSTWLNSKYICSDIDSGVSSPDFMKIAQAYNIKTITINNHDNLDETIEYVLAYNSGPIICDVSIRPNQEILPKLSFGRPLEDMYPHLSESELNNSIKF